MVKLIVQGANFVEDKPHWAVAAKSAAATTRQARPPLGSPPVVPPAISSAVSVRPSASTVNLTVFPPVCAPPPSAATVATDPNTPASHAMRRVRSGSLSEPHAPPQPTLSRVALDPEAPQAYSSHVRLYKAAHRSSAATLHGMSGSRSMAGLLRPVSDDVAQRGTTATSQSAPSDATAPAQHDAIAAAAIISDDGAASATELGAGTGATTAPSMAAPAPVTAPITAAPSASAAASTAASTGARDGDSSLAAGPRLPLLRGREKLSLLRLSPLFSMMSEPALVALCGLAEEREMRKMQTIHPSRSIFVLVYVDE